MLRFSHVLCANAFMFWFCRYQRVKPTHVAFVSSGEVTMPTGFCADIQIFKERLIWQHRPRSAKRSQRERAPFGC